MLDYALSHGVQPIVIPEIVGEATFKPRDLKALVKLYRENANTLTPDPVYSAFHDSHPPAPLRIAHLQGMSS